MQGDVAKARDSKPFSASKIFKSKMIQLFSRFGSVWVVFLWPTMKPKMGTFAKFWPSSARTETYVFSKYTGLVYDLLYLMVCINPWLGRSKVHKTNCFAFQCLHTTLICT